MKWDTIEPSQGNFNFGPAELLAVSLDEAARSSPQRRNRSQVLDTAEAI
jgi:hypothetical protein